MRTKILQVLNAHRPTNETCDNIIGLFGDTLGKCEWRKSEYTGVHMSACGKAWYISNDHGPKDNFMDYCPFCGKVLEEKV